VRVVIHVRRTDHVGVLYWHDPYPDYFVRSMAYFTDCLPRVQFIVISDDMKWCHQNIAGKHVDFMDGVRRPEVDLAIASLCDHAIITIGTFGWWSAWLANGVTIMQNDTRKP
jgi:galactoside 2-L-fucosyltransferase 1/2